MCCTTVRRGQTWSIYFPRVRATLVRLVGSSFPQSQRGDSSRSRGRRDRLSFQTAATLSRPAIYRASLVGDQATMKRRLGAVNGRRLVDSYADRSFAGLEKRMDEAVVCGRKRTEYQTRDAVRDQSQQSKEMSWILWASGRVGARR